MIQRVLCWLGFHPVEAIDERRYRPPELWDWPPLRVKMCTRCGRIIGAEATP